MATQYKIRYKNWCIPQEQLVENGRWFLDSDCGKKLSGDAETSATLTAVGVLSTASLDSGSNTVLYDKDAGVKEFIYIKHIGSSGIVKIALNETHRYCYLEAGEALATELSSACEGVKASTESGSIEIEYILAT